MKVKFKGSQVIFYPKTTGDLQNLVYAANRLGAEELPPGKARKYRPNRYVPRRLCFSCGNVSTQSKSGICAGCREKYQ